MAEPTIVDVVGVGLNATDTLIRLPHFPSLDSKMELRSAEILAGGQVASAMVACRRWGLRTRYIGKVGDDSAGRLQADELARAGVESHLLEVPDAPSQIAFILVAENSGERTILWKRDERLTIQPEELERGWITGSRALLVDGHDTAAAAQAARWAREASIPVVADLDDVYLGVQALLECTDYLISSRDFPERLLGVNDPLESLPMISREFGCRVSGVTLGHEGALAWDGERFHYSPAFRVKTVDTTGAGDIFHAGLVYGVLQEWPLYRILEFSCAAAGLNCTAMGARGGIRPLVEIERLMKEGEHYERAFDASELERRRTSS